MSTKPVSASTNQDAIPITRERFKEFEDAFLRLDAVIRPKALRIIEEFVETLKLAQPETQHAMLMTIAAYNQAFGRAAKKAGAE